MQLYIVCKYSAEEKVLEYVAQVKFLIFVAGWLSITKYNPRNLSTIHNVVDVEYLFLMS